MGRTKGRRAWDSSRKGSPRISCSLVNSMNFMKLDDDPEGVAVQQPHFDRGCDVGMFSAETE